MAIELSPLRHGGSAARRPKPLRGVVVHLVKISKQGCSCVSKNLKSMHRCMMLVKPPIPIEHCPLWAKTCKTQICGHTREREFATPGMQIFPTRGGDCPDNRHNEKPWCSNSRHRADDLPHSSHLLLYPIELSELVPPRHRVPLSVDDVILNEVFLVEIVSVGPFRMAVSRAYAPEAVQVELAAYW